MPHWLLPRRYAPHPAGVHCSGLIVHDSRCMVQGSGFRVQNLRLMVQGPGIPVSPTLNAEKDQLAFFRSLHLHWRSPESSGLCYKSRQLNRTI